MGCALPVSVSAAITGPFGGMTPYCGSAGKAVDYSGISVTVDFFFLKTVLMYKSQVPV